MAERPSVLIVGVGVFGRLLAAELLRTTNADLVLASRRPPDAFAEELGEPDRVSTATVDLTVPGSLAVAARDRVAVACTAGPFQVFPGDLPLAAVRAGAHWVDISDDRDWVISHLRDEDLDRAAHAGEVAVMPGLSTVPSLSGALARIARDRLPTASRSRVTLCIGNRNAKGPGAIRSAFDGGFRDPIAVDLPPPFGRRAAYLGHSADEDLFREDLGLEAEFRVALEWRAAGVLMAGLGPIWSRLDAGRRSALGHALSAASRPFGWFGTSAGCLLVEVWDGGRVVGLAALGDQGIAIVPCAIALERILTGGLGTPGVVHPVRWLSGATGSRRSDDAASGCARGTRPAPDLLGDPFSDPSSRGFALSRPIRALHRTGRHRFRVLGGQDAATHRAERPGYPAAMGRALGSRTS